MFSTQNIRESRTVAGLDKSKVITNIALWIVFKVKGTEVNSLLNLPPGNS